MQTIGASSSKTGIEYMSEPYSREAILSTLHPFVREWFENNFKDFSPPQYFSIMNIHSRVNTLISSPTGSGKTLSAFLAIINELVTLAEHGGLEDRVYCVYISPLKALGNDIERNLNWPLAAIQEIALRAGKDLGIRVAVRSGDTTDYQKQKMLEKPPHILITTPESLSIVLTAQKFRDLLGGVQWVVVDEIHSLAASKRGVHLSLSLERLQEMTWFTRVGLSATVAPLEDFAEYLVGYNDDKTSRGCKIVDVSYAKKLDLQVVSPVRNLITTPYEKIQDALYDKLHAMISEHKMTLVFTNTRSATERVVHELKDRYRGSYITIEEQVRTERGTELVAEVLEGAADKYSSHPLRETAASTLHESGTHLTAVQGSTSSKAAHTEPTTVVRSVIAAHHSSLSKDHRLRVEERMKEGKLRVVVSSTSLEMGIDIGAIDLVVLLGSPKSISRALQRIGRAGHRLSDVSKGRIMVLDRDDLVECSILLKDAVERKIDRITIPRNCLDVLSQTIYGMAITKQMTSKELLQSLRRSYCYHTLTKDDFESTLKYLCGEFSELEERHTYAKIWWDKDTDMIGRKGKLARLLFMTNTGTIPDETNVLVKIGEAVIGTIAEPFLERLKRGDVFVLGGDTYEFQFARGMVAQVRASAGRLPTVPSWYSEMLPLNFDLASEIGKFRRYINNMLVHGNSRSEIIQYIQAYVYADEYACEAIYEYFAEQFRFSQIPHDKKLLIEHIKEGAKHYVVFHSLHGRRVNDALSRAVGYTLGKLYRSDMEVGITDNGFYVMSRQPLIAKRALTLLGSDELYRVLEHAVHNSEVLRRRFRHCAARSLMILRNYKGNRKSVGKQQVSSQTLLAAVRRMGNEFPILKEARREVLQDLMDEQHARQVLAEIERGETKIEEVHIEMPSPFSFSIVLQGYSDVLKIEDRQLFLQRMHEQVLAKLSGANNEKQSITEAAGSFSYEQHWKEEETLKEKEEEDLRLVLKQQLYRAARKEKLEANIVFEASKLIDGDRKGFSDEFITYLQKLLTGAVPKSYEDDLVKFFMERVGEISAA